jgi:hypothetical protein
VRPAARDAIAGEADGQGTYRENISPVSKRWLSTDPVEIKLINNRSPPLIAPSVACDLRFLFHLANAAITGLLSQVFIINSSELRIRR